MNEQDSYIWNPYVRDVPPPAKVFNAWLEQAGSTCRVVDGEQFKAEQVNELYASLGWPDRAVNGEKAGPALRKLYDHFFAVAQR